MADHPHKKIQRARQVARRHRLASLAQRGKKATVKQAFRGRSAATAGKIKRV